MKKNTENMAYVIFLSIVGAIGGFLFGYDTAVISGTIDDVALLFNLNTAQQGWYVGCALVGSIIGVVFAGTLSDKFGRRPSLWFAAVLFTGSAVGCMLAPSFNMLVWYRIIGGVGVGIASIVSPLYISEISPARYRGSLVTLYQLAITVGIVASYFANAQLLAYSQTAAESGGWLEWVAKEEVWRAMLGMESLPAGLFFVILFFIPESPRWQIAQNKTVAAVKTLTKIIGEKEATIQVTEIRQMIESESNTNWRMLFRPGYRLALLIGVSLAILGQFMGVNVIFYYGPMIFKEAGMAAQGSLDFQIIIGIVNVLSTMLGMFLVDRIGRKKLVYIGVTGMLVMLLFIGYYFYAQIATPMILLYMIVAYIFFCAISICVVIWVLLSEMYPVKVRGLAMSFAGFALWIGTFLIGQLTPLMLEGLGPASTFWVFAVMCLPYLGITYFLVPETTGRSLEEIEKIWSDKSRGAKMR